MNEKYPKDIKDAAVMFMNWGRQTREVAEMFGIGVSVVEYWRRTNKCNPPYAGPGACIGPRTWRDIDALMNKTPALSISAIAQRTGLSRPTITKIRKEILDARNRGCGHRKLWMEDKAWSWITTHQSTGS